MDAAYPAPPKILYVDDDRDVRTIASMSIALNADITIETCESGTSAIAAMTRFQPDLVVLDASSRGVDQTTLMNQMNDDLRLAHIPVVFMSSNATPREIRRLCPLGAIAVIEKPFDPMSLAEDLSIPWRRCILAE